MKTLIIYASKHGCAEKCANLLKDKLKGEVTTENIKNKKSFDLNEFDNIIIGGSIYVGKIQKEITEICSNNLNTLLNKKFGFFICCMNKEETLNAFNASFPKELLEKAIVKESFGGEFNFKDMNFFEKTITKVISKVLAKKDENISKINTKQDISMIEIESINKFAQLINN